MMISGVDMGLQQSRKNDENKLANIYLNIKLQKGQPRQRWFNSLDSDLRLGNLRLVIVELNLRQSACELSSMLGSSKKAMLSRLVQIGRRLEK